MTARTDKSLRYLPFGLLLVVGLVVALVVVIRQTGPPPPIIGQIQPFLLTNQLNQPVQLSDLKGNLWVANIIFTRCPGPCKQMSRRMAALQKRWAGNASVRFISLTTDPDHDTPAVLKVYAEEMGADPSRWQFLTGPKPTIRELAVDGLKLTVKDTEADQRANPADLFVHSTISVVVDRHGRLRGAVEALEKDSEAQFDSLIHRLLKE
ncbi:MAG: SCO family protein [Verrucomicrobia bacterium]|nr:SCO family protein [Verrucomicrobiota bacterium]MBI3870671.1 SCO family protein [Verrucomicrobiota bacterium]